MFTTENRLSNCCGARPYGELDPYIERKDVKRLGIVTRELYIGRCSKCGDGAEFLTDEELEKYDENERKWNELRGELVWPGR